MKKVLFLFVLILVTGIMTFSCKKQETNHEAYVEIVNQANCDVEYAIAGTKEEKTGTVAANSSKKIMVILQNENIPIHVIILNWASCHLVPPMDHQVQLHYGETKQVVITERP